MCDEAGIFNCTSLAIGSIYVWLCSPQASNNNNNNSILYPGAWVDQRNRQGG